MRRAERGRALNPFVIRAGTIADTEVCLPLALLADPERDAADWQGSLLRDVEDPAHHLVVAESNEEIVGYGRASLFEPEPTVAADTAPSGYYLTGLFVRPDRRRVGVGQALTRARLVWIAEKATDAWYFANARNLASIELHRRFGFEEITRSFSFPGLTFDGGEGILFRLDLDTYHPAVTEGLMDRGAAHAFARDRCLKETTYRHLVSVEGVMRSLARRFDEDQDLWGLTGLFHDLDQDHTGDDGAHHARLAAGWLREAGVDDRVVNGVLAHAYEEYRTDRMSRAVVHADAVAGLLVAAALVRPERSVGMKVSSVKKKLKERSFAPGVHRDEVLGAEASLGLPLDEFLAISIEGLQEIAPEIDL